MAIKGVLLVGSVHAYRIGGTCSPTKRQLRIFAFCKKNIQTWPTWSGLNQARCGRDNNSGSAGDSLHCFARPDGSSVLAPCRGIGTKALTLSPEFLMVVTCSSGCLPAPLPRLSP